MSIVQLMRSYHPSAADTGIFRAVLIRGGADLAIIWWEFRLANGCLPWQRDANSHVNCSWHSDFTRTRRAHLERIVDCQANMVMSDEVHTANCAAIPGTGTCRQ